MANTHLRTKVQKVSSGSVPATTHVYIGDSPAQATRLSVVLDGSSANRAYYSAIVGALTRAMLAGRFATVWWDDVSDRVTSVTQEPGERGGQDG